MRNQVKWNDVKCSLYLGRMSERRVKNDGERWGFEKKTKLNMFVSWKRRLPKRVARATASFSQWCNRASKHVVGGFRRLTMWHSGNGTEKKVHMTIFRKKRGSEKIDRGAISPKQVSVRRRGIFGNDYVNDYVNESRKSNSKISSCVVLLKNLTLTKIFRGDRRTGLKSSLGARLWDYPRNFHPWDHMCVERIQTSNKLPRASRVLAS